MSTLRHVASNMQRFTTHLCTITAYIISKTMMSKVLAERKPAYRVNYLCAQRIVTHDQEPPGIRGHLKYLRTLVDILGQLEIARRVGFTIFFLPLSPFEVLRRMNKSIRMTDYHFGHI